MASFRSDKWVPLAGREDNKFSFKLNIEVKMDMLL